jgi:glycosyltransferase involved in cell wall biosynthesis
MLVSTIIPTIGRESLSRSVESVLGQNFSENDYEIIVVNDSGVPLPEQDWQLSEKVKVVETNRAERSTARNTGAVAARGKYLHFLDDDDWILPNAFSSFFRLAQTSRAAWLYGSTQLVDRQGNPLILLKHQMQGNIFVKVMAGEWIPLQASLIDRGVFHQVGGFEPRLSVTEDVDLARRIALSFEFSSISEVVACIGMGKEDSTTEYDMAPVYSRQARERILDKKGVFTRLLGSADSSEWRGRIPRIYLTSMIWNIQRGRFSTALSRGLFAQVSMIFAGRSLLNTSFWRSLLKQYESVTFTRGFQEAANRELGSTV